MTNIVGPTYLPRKVVNFCKKWPFVVQVEDTMSYADAVAFHEKFVGIFGVYPHKQVLCTSNRAWYGFYSARDAMIFKLVFG